jgi:putative ABC transport system permease protein
MMELMDLKLIKGNMPTEINDIILHKQVAVNKKLEINDFIGRRISKQETLPEVYHIVGIIDGSSVVSFAPIDFYLDFYQLPYEYLYGGIILPKEGELDKMNQALDTLEPSNYQIDTLTIQEAAAEENITKIGILVSAINIFIILIVSSCIGFLCYIYFSQRRSEFGLLWALGYSRQQVINRAFAEVNGINLAGYIMGILISLLIGVILNYSYYIPSGDYLQIIDIRCFLGAACSPIFVTLFSLIPIWRMLKKLDPISIIDGITI